jgi:hypothetical protein
MKQMRKDICMSLHFISSKFFDIFLSRRAWICDRTTISSEAFFDYGHPPIIIANVEPFSKRSDEGYEANPVRLRDMKRIIRIGSVKYVI